MQLSCETHSNLHAPLSTTPSPSLAPVVAAYVQQCVALSAAAPQGETGTSQDPIVQTLTAQALPVAAAAILAAAMAPDVSDLGQKLFQVVSITAEIDADFGSAAFASRVFSSTAGCSPAGQALRAGESAAHKIGAAASPDMGAAEPSDSKKRRVLEASAM